MSITVVSHPYCALHEVPEHHPEEPARLAAVQDQLIRSGLEYVLQQVDGRAASNEDLYRVHSATYIDDLCLREPAAGDAPIWLDPDTLLGAGSIRAARHAAGAALTAVDAVMQHSDHQAFANIRPPGHHAGRDQAGGFCLFNNVAVAAAYAMQRYGLQRVAIVDFDVHHGNGTEDIFAQDERVLFCSSFQHPLYPFSGVDSISPLLIDVPLPAATRGAEWRQAVAARWFPAIDHFQPELLLVSAGFDGHVEDDMAQFMLTEQDYQWLASELQQLAKRHCQGRLVAVLEGGYDHSALGRSVVAFLKGWL